MEIESKSEFISILICSRDRRHDLEKLVASLGRMRSGYSFEIIVVEETDNPRLMGSVRYGAHPIKNKGIAYARNLALANARGDIVVFLDDDCRIYESWLDNLLEPFKDETVVGVQGGITIPSSSNAIGWCESILGFPGGGIRRVIESKGENQETKEISTLNCAYRKWVLEVIGGFDDKLRLGGEDYILAKQATAHGRCLFVPNALVTHAVRGSLAKIWHWFLKRGRAEIGVIRYGGYKKTTYCSLLIASLTIKVLLIVLAGIVLADGLLLISIAGLVCYGSIQFIRYYPTWRNSPATKAALMVIPIVKITMDLAMDWGRIRGFIFD